MKKPIILTLSKMSSIQVIKRSGEVVPLDVGTIQDRLRSLVEMEPKLSISIDQIVIKTVSSLTDIIHTSEIDSISATICAGLIALDPDYNKLAARITMSDLHKNVSGDLQKYATDLESYYDRDYLIKILHPKTIAFINKNHKQLQQFIDYSLDFRFSYIGMITLIQSYLLSYKFNGKTKKITKERPQQMYLRVAIGIHLNDISDNGECSSETMKSIHDTYMLLAKGYYTHATPTLFNAGTKTPTLSSCYLLSVDDDLENIYDRLKDISKISKFSGGVGIHVSAVRGHGATIGSTIGESQGLVPMLKVFNESTRYVSQGGGKRKGSTAVYIEPWHSDIMSVLHSQKQQGQAENLCRDLFVALWVPDLFMERVKKSYESSTPVMWSLMSPDSCKRLNEVYGKEFTELYEKYESEGRFVKQINIKTLWNEILSIQIESGKPYLMFKDHVNRKTNQNNLGTIKSSNLCVHGDTQILTENGYFPIKTLANKTVKIWDTEKFIDAPVQQTGTNQKLLKITTDDGAELMCTEYHRFDVLDKNIIKHAKDLKVGDMLPFSKMPVINGDSKYDIKDAYNCGFSCENDINDIVPTNATILNKIEWLSGYLDAYATLYGESTKMNAIYVRSVSKQFLMKVKLLCNTLGLNPEISFTTMSTNGINNIYTLMIHPKDTCSLYNDFGMKTEHIKSTKSITNRSVPTFSRIASIKEVDGLHDTYCFRSIDTEKGIFNGIPTRNCSEITIYSDRENIGVCNLASICLPKFVKEKNGKMLFDFNKLHMIAQKTTENMNRVIDNNLYPLEQAYNSDSKNRPIGVGIQGLSEVFMMMGVSYTSDDARLINKQIMETIYHGCLTASNKLAQIHGTYKTFSTSMTSQGILQFDLWNVKPTSLWDWGSLKNDIKLTGLYNSLLVALMPTAGTSVISGHTESFEAPQSNIMTRSTLSGRFIVVNEHLVKDLKKLNLWSQSMCNKIIAHEGSIQNIKDIPQNIRDVYKTIYEYRLSHLIEMDADRGAFVCQSSSSNRYLPRPSMDLLSRCHILGYDLGLKTSSYYTRIKPQALGKQLTSFESTKKETSLPPAEEEQECLMCMA